MQLSVLPEGSLGLAFQLEREEFYIVLSYDENRQVVVREALLVQQQLNHR